MQSQIARNGLETLVWGWGEAKGRSCIDCGHTLSWTHHYLSGWWSGMVALTNISSTAVTRAHSVMTSLNTFHHCTHMYTWEEEQADWGPGRDYRGPAAVGDCKGPVVVGGCRGPVVVGDCRGPVVVGGPGSRSSLEDVEQGLEGLVWGQCLGEGPREVGVLAGQEALGYARGCYWEENCCKSGDQLYPLPQTDCSCKERTTWQYKVHRVVGRPASSVGRVVMMFLDFLFLALSVILLSDLVHVLL